MEKKENKPKNSKNNVLLSFRLFISPIKEVYYVSIGDLVKSNLVDLIYPAMQETCNAVPRNVT